MNKTPIQWTDKSINPIRARWKEGTLGAQNQRVAGHYCEKISDGCKFCYSSKMQPRFQMPQFQDQDLDQIEVYLDENALQDMLRARKPVKVFPCDMTDMFGDWVPDEWIDKILAVAALNQNITLQILTKRAERMREYFSRLVFARDEESRRAIGGTCYVRRPGWSGSKRDGDKVFLVSEWPLPNVHLGVSVESEPYLSRVEHLKQTPAALRFVSQEPALGPVDFRPHLTRTVTAAADMSAAALECGALGERIPGIDWIIYGGESGPNARPNELIWARTTRDACKAAGVAFFMKQAGAYALWDGTAEASYNPRASNHATTTSMGWRLQLKDSHGGDLSELPEDLRVREFPTVHESRITNHA